MRKLPLKQLARIWMINRKQASLFSCTIDSVDVCRRNKAIITYSGTGYCPTRVNNWPSIYWWMDGWVWEKRGTGHLCEKGWRVKKSGKLFENYKLYSNSDDLIHQLTVQIIFSFSYPVYVSLPPPPPPAKCCTWFPPLTLVSPQLKMRNSRR